ncbi:hypothetical protein MSAN_02524300 [Mycena sanguinolenta]|uniref:Uncharacterized protein n=1 Tax=Mycena sanguinolenta TaxID=230812 RepID=A0A8H6TWK6_9AGAR|nr:hypothetical protein MSAN_02524300 [Mycena sanguinolenta]
MDDEDDGRDENLKRVPSTKRSKNRILGFRGSGRCPVLSSAFALPYTEPTKGKHLTTRDLTLASRLASLVSDLTALFDGRLSEGSAIACWPFAASLSASSFPLLPACPFTQVNSLHKYGDFSSAHGRHVFSPINLNSMSTPALE